MQTFYYSNKRMVVFLFKMSQSISSIYFHQPLKNNLFHQIILPSSPLEDHFIFLFIVSAHTNGQFYVLTKSGPIKHVHACECTCHIFSFSLTPSFYLFLSYSQSKVPCSYGFPSVCFPNLGNLKSYSFMRHCNW